MRGQVEMSVACAAMIGARIELRAGLATIDKSQETFALSHWVANPHIDFLSTSRPVLFPSVSPVGGYLRGKAEVFEPSPRLSHGQILATHDRFTTRAPSNGSVMADKYTHFCQSISHHGT